MLGRESGLLGLGLQLHAVLDARASCQVSLFSTATPVKPLAPYVTRILLWANSNLPSDARWTRGSLCTNLDCLAPGLQPILSALTCLKNSSCGEVDCSSPHWRLRFPSAASFRCSSVSPAVGGHGPDGGRAACGHRPSSFLPWSSNSALGPLTPDPALFLLDAELRTRRCCPSASLTACSPASPPPIDNDV